MDFSLQKNKSLFRFVSTPLADMMLSILSLSKDFSVAGFDNAFNSSIIAIQKFSR